jgi:hypothetical protein
MRIMLAIAALAALLCASGSLYAQPAQDAEETRMAKEHYKAGLDAYKAGNYDVAIKELKRAYLLKRLPPLLLNIGATYRKMNNIDMSLHFYKKYLDEAPPDAKDRPDVEKIVAELQKEASGEAAAAAPPSPPVEKEPAQEAKEAKEPPPAPVKSGRVEFSHNIIDSAPPDMPIDVRVSMSVMKGVKVYVNYRQPGEADFTPVLMKRHGREKVGRIPAEAVSGKALQYYIEARDPTGNVVKSSGSASDPNIIMVDPSAQPQMLASAEERSELDAREGSEGGEEARTKKRRNLDDEAAPVTGMTAGERAERRKRESSGGSRFSGVFWGGLAVAIAGVGGLASGIAMGVLAKNQSDAVANDSRINETSCGSGPCSPLGFSQAQFPGEQTDLDIQKKGQSYDLAAKVLLPLGGVLLAGGVSMMIVDVYRGKGADRPKKHRAAPRTNEEARLLYLAPTVGPNLVGAGAGFSF